MKIKSAKRLFLFYGEEELRIEKFPGLITLSIRNNSGIVNARDDRVVRKADQT